MPKTRHRQSCGRCVRNPGDAKAMLEPEASAGQAPATTSASSGRPIEANGIGRAGAVRVEIGRPKIDRGITL